MAFLVQDIVLDESAFSTASQDMATLKQDAANLKAKLEKMYEDVSDALDTTAGDEIKVTAKDVLLQPIEDIGVDNAFLYWTPIIDGDLDEYPAEYIDADEVYRFSNLPINNEAVPYIVISDKLGNSNTYYFTTQKETESSDVVEFMLDKNEDNSVTLALEKEPPCYNC